MTMKFSFSQQLCWLSSKNSSKFRHQISLQKHVFQKKETVDSAYKHFASDYRKCDYCEQNIPE